MVYVIILSVIAGAVGLYYFLFKDLDRFKKYDIPHLKPLPFIGNMAPSIFRMVPISKFLQQIYNVHPEAKYVGLYDFKTPLIMLRDTELIKSIAVKNADMFQDHPTFVTEEQDTLFSRDLFSLRGDKWRQTRSMLSPAFTSSKMKSMFKLMSDYAANFANFVTQLPPEQKVIETKDIFTRYTNDMIATCAFGVTVDSMRDPKNLFYVYGREATTFDSASVLKVYIFRSLPWLARIIKLKLIREKIVNFFQDLVESTIKTRDENNIVRPDMLQLMMETRNKKEGKGELTIEDMTSQAFSFFFGGFESTATLMCFAAHEIGVNEDIRKKLQNEIDQVLEDTNGQAPYEAINGMEYLDAVLNEALRMYPVATLTNRACTEDFELSPTLPGVKPYTMKKGDDLWIPIYALHHDPKYFEDPEKFDPERFLGEQKKHILNTGAYLPFGLGPRMCIGNRFALLETKVLLFHLLARCDLLLCEKTPVPLKFVKGDFNINPEGGFWLKAVPRKNPYHTVVIDNINSTSNL
ncbi:cytochrome P450 9e2-like [Odontomachus brunneus]|uniref:cytochrome P450 9e2-like n=1 Tax=Odontomachus brunneus TaxID=486640 RepID=UPI0013F2A049|nr:cytochrome P450 9e2-like [Odontomachus brunneus]